MAAWHCLALIRPLDPASGQRVDVRVASAQLRGITGLGGMKWAPAMIEAPKLSWQLFDGDFSSPISVGNADIALSLKVLVATHEHPDAARYYWQGAPVTLWLGKVGETWPWRTYFEGEVGNASPKDNRVTLAAAVNGEAFEVDVLPTTYAGTGGAEGDTNLTGQVKPLALGWPQNVQPVLINAVDSIYQFSAYGPIEAVTMLYERGSEFGAADANYASYSALQAATIAPGKWATCLAEGLVRLGAPEYGVITGDIKGHAVGGTAPRRAGDQIALLADLAGVDPDRLADASLTAMDSDAPYNGSRMLTEQITFFAAARRMALECNYQAGIWLDGRFFVAKPDLDRQEAMTLHAQGKRMPQVAEAQEENVSRPYWKVTFGAERSFRVHAPDEIASGGYNWRGAYVSTASYRKDDVVFADDGRAFAYINATMASGNAPPAAPATSNTYWAVIGEATEGAPSGTTVAGRDADDVASTIAAGGGVDDDQVSTTAIIAEAVTTKTYAFTAGSVSITSGGYTYQEVQSATITTFGEDVEIDVYFELFVVDNCKYQYRILRDGTPLIDLGPITVSTNDGPPAFFRYVDSPAAGTYEYTLEVACNDATDINVLNRGLSAKEIKR
jgi:hypothetical protein